MTERQSSTDVLTAFLANSSARCPGCGYALRGCTSDKCPECGCELALGIVSAKPTTSTWWIASVFGSALSVFLCVVILTHFMTMVTAVLQMPGLVKSVRAGFASSNELPRWPAVFTMVILCLLSGGSLAWVIAHRRAFAQLPTARRMLVGVLCWLSPLIIFGFIALWTRG